MFETGAYIICGQHGVCRVESIGPIKLLEASEGKDYYTLYPIYSKGGVIYVPADSKKIVMRHIISREEAEKLIGELETLEMIGVDNERQREEILKRALRTCDVRQWARVIKTVHARKTLRLAQGKKVTAGDERCLHAAQENLYGELAVSLGIEKSAVESYIGQAIRGKR